MLKRHKTRRFGRNLTWIFTAVIFVILLLSSFLMGTIVYTFIRLGWLSFRDTPKPIGGIVFIAFVSVLTGTLLSLLASRIPLRPIRHIIAAINELAEGRFTARLHLKGPHEFEELSQSFNRMAEELGSLEMLRSDFINNFSHEFKTPIVSMRGFARLLKDGDPTPEERAEYLDIIISESNRLSMLATNVLLLSKVETQRIVSDVAAFDLSEQIRRAVLLLEPKWSNKGISMDVQLDETTAEGSEDLLKQVWINLIDNAVKFSPEGGTIRIGLNAGTDRILVRISDEGCGMDEQTRSRVFDKFYQGDPSRSMAGNGLGLTIAEKIVSLHHGTISLESIPGKGTRVTVSLPARTNSEKQAESDKRNRTGGA